MVVIVIVVVGTVGEVVIVSRIVAVSACRVKIVAVRAVIGPVVAPSAEGHPSISAQSDDKSYPQYV